ncbi:MAG: nucleoside 2-deoxyribosyltransferase, partial [Planctomycetes bacterium]|nr:nucleoside 2-deoxyribosyltransferase [Planctomycetota bacterium]
TAQDEVEFWVKGGYDYVPLSLGLIEVGGVLSGEATMRKRAHYSLYTDEDVEMKWAAEHKGVITSFADLERYKWPTLNQMDFSPLEALSAAMPPEMKIIAILGKVYTAVWMLMGFESFCTATLENPELVKAMFKKTGEIQYAALEKALSFDRVGAAFMSDDIAYGQALMVNPRIYREHLFPWYKRMGDLCRERGLAFIYHSDGDLREVLDDLIACGFNALHPIEPKAMDIREIKRRVAGKLCLLGNIEVDRLSRGTPDEVRGLCRANLRDLTYDAGYCLGSSNSVTSYIPVANYRAMIETVFTG